MSQHFLIVAGDPSGDLLAANLIQAMKKLQSNISVTALGGKHLKQCSERFLVDLVSQYAVGFWISPKKIFFFKEVLEKIVKKELEHHSIDSIILVDFYGFNRHVASLAARYKKPVYYYVCPQFWASRPGRLNFIKSFVRRFLVLFPFEEDFYKARGLSATFVGHPLLDPILNIHYNGSQKNHVEPLIGLLPGSRPDEVRRHMPVMLEVCERIVKDWPGARFILFAAPDLNTEIYSEVLGPGARLPFFLEIVRDENYTWRSQLDVAVTASGLEALESALLGIPMAVIYKMPWVTYLVARAIVTIPHIAIPNILAGRLLVPEFIQHKAKAGPIAETLKKWLKDPKERERIKQRLIQLREGFGQPGASERAAKAILEAAA